jgi:nucleoside 2-deoxyribosyltransferase
MKRIYLAGPLFTHAEQAWLKTAKTRIEELAARQGHEAEVLWPFEFFSEAELAALGARRKERIFSGCLEGLGRADMLVALLDGPLVDDGTAFEIGWYFAKGLGPILGVRTDFRKAGETPDSLVNCMLEMPCERIFDSLEGLLRGLKVYFPKPER